MDTKKIAIIIPGGHDSEWLGRRIESLATRTSYPNYEIVVVQDDSKLSDALVHFPRMQDHLLRFSGAFNGSAVKNFAVKQTNSPWLLFLDSNIEVVETDWLTTMAEHIQRPEVGAVGVRLVNPSNTIEHGGIILGVAGVAQPAFCGFPAEHPGANRQLQITRNCSAVSGT